MASDVRRSVASSIWNSSSRGYVSRMFASDFPAWLCAMSPACSAIRATFRRSSGMSLGFALYAVDV